MTPQFGMSLKLLVAKHALNRHLVAQSCTSGKKKPTLDIIIIPISTFNYWRELFLDDNLPSSTWVAKLTCPDRFHLHIHINFHQNEFLYVFRKNSVGIVW